jgi:sortase A
MEDFAMMVREKRSVEDYSIEELEALLTQRKLEAHQSRLHRFRKTGRALPGAETQLSQDVEIPEEQIAADGGAQERGTRLDIRRLLRSTFNRLLLWIEIAAVFGMAFIFFKGYGLLQTLNQEAAQAMVLPTPTSSPLITAIVLPSGHTPPTSPDGAQPNEAEIPANLKPLVPSLAQIPAPTPGPQHARQIFIEELWASPQPIVQGDDWEQLKKGVGQHIGSANPGEVGNLVLSAHNDIFGELFRYLDRLKPGDEIHLMTATQEFVYIVTGLQIVEPTDVEVMSPTSTATITLISCYPYLVDSQRIVVFGELQED